jgi:hypothetical protein
MYWSLSFIIRWVYTISIGVFYFFFGAFSGILGTAFSALKRLKLLSLEVKVFMTKYFINNIKNQKIVVFSYYLYFGVTNLPAFSREAIILFFLILTIYMVLVIAIRKHFGLGNIYILLYLYLTYFTAFLIYTKQVNPQSLLLVSAYIGSYICLNIIITAVLKSKDNFDFHFAKEFSLFSDLTKFIGVFLLVALPPLSQFSLAFYMNILVYEVLLLVFLFIILTLLLVGLVQLVIFTWCNPSSSGFYALCKTCGIVAVPYITLITMGGTFPIVPLSGLPLESAIQTQLLGCRLTSLGHKYWYHQACFLLPPSEVSTLKNLESGIFDVENAQKKCELQMEARARRYGKAFAEGAIDATNTEAKNKINYFWPGKK